MCLAASLGGVIGQSKTGFSVEALLEPLSDPASGSELPATEDGEDRVVVVALGVRGTLLVL